MRKLKDCQSAISRLSLASRLAARHAPVHSRRRNSARKSRATVLERRLAGVVEKNFFASGFGMLLSPFSLLSAVQIPFFVNHRRANLEMAP